MSLFLLASAPPPLTDQATFSAGCLQGAHWINSKVKHEYVCWQANYKSSLFALHPHLRRKADVSVPSPSASPLQHHGATTKGPHEQSTRTDSWMPSCRVSSGEVFACNALKMWWGGALIRRRTAADSGNGARIPHRCFMCTDGAPQPFLCFGLCVSFRLMVNVMKQ